VGLIAGHELGLKFYKGISALISVSVYEAIPEDV
jgi:hypothetical protein